MRSGFSIVSGFDAPIHWECVLDSHKATWPFSQARSRIDRDLGNLLRGPQVYRFNFYDADDRLSAVYIGEAGCFLKRHTHYKPKPPREEFVLKKYRQTRVSLKIAGWKGLVELQRLVVKEFRLNVVIFDQASLSSPFVRKFLENLAVCQTEAAGVRVLNKGRDQEIKKLAIKAKKSRSLKANAA